MNLDYVLLIIISTAMAGDSQDRTLDSMDFSPADALCEHGLRTKLCLAQGTSAYAITSWAQGLLLFWLPGQGLYNSHTGSSNTFQEGGLAPLAPTENLPIMGQDHPLTIAQALTTISLI